MASTYELIASQTLGSDTASVTFSGIPGTYTDLYAVASARTNRASNTWADTRIRFNGAANDTNLSGRYLQGTGSAAASGTTAYAWVGDVTASTATASTFASLEIYLPNYAGSTNKSYSSTCAHETNSSTAYLVAIAGLWSDTSAITSLTLVPVGSFVTGSSFFLFGITKA